jgi:hypothetical protein
MTIWWRVTCWISKVTRARPHAHTHTEICNTYCFFMAVAVSWTRLSVTLYVHCLSCWKSGMKYVVVICVTSAIVIYLFVYYYAVRLFYGLDDPDFESRFWQDFFVLHTGSGAHPSSHQVGTAVLTRGVMLPTNHRVIPKLRISGAVLPLLYAWMAWTGSALPCLRPFSSAVSVCIASHSRIIGEWRNGKGCGRNRLWYIEVLSRYCLTELELGTLLIQVSGVTDTAACSVGGFVVGGGDC